MSINRFKGGEPAEYVNRIISFEAGDLPKHRLQAMADDDPDFADFLDLWRVEQKAHDQRRVLENNWKARNNARMNERFDDPWGGM